MEYDKRSPALLNYAWMQFTLDVASELQCSSITLKSNKTKHTYARLNSWYGVVLL